LLRRSIGAAKAACAALAARRLGSTLQPAAYSLVTSSRLFTSAPKPHQQRLARVRTLGRAFCIDEFS